LLNEETSRSLKQAEEIKMSKAIEIADDEA